MGYNAGVNGKGWQVISHIYGNIHAVVKSGLSMTSVKAAEEQAAQISKFAFNHGLTLNRSNTEVVKFSTDTTSYDKPST